jgi:hypothetical protein
MPCDKFYKTALSDRILTKPNHNILLAGLVCLFTNKDTMLLLIINATVSCMCKK